MFRYTGAAEIKTLQCCAFALSTCSGFKDLIKNNISVFNVEIQFIF